MPPMLHFPRRCRVSWWDVGHERNAAAGPTMSAPDQRHRQYTRLELERADPPPAKSARKDARPLATFVGSSSRSGTSATTPRPPRVRGAHHHGGRPPPSSLGPAFAQRAQDPGKRVRNRSFVQHEACVPRARRRLCSQPFPPPREEMASGRPPGRDIAAHISPGLPKHPRGVFAPDDGTRPYSPQRGAATRKGGVGHERKGTVAPSPPPPRGPSRPRLRSRSRTRGNSRPRPGEHTPKGHRAPGCRR